MQGVRGQLTPRLLSLQHRGKLFPAQKDVCGHRVYASQCSSLSSSLLSCTKGCPCSCTPVSWDTSFQAAEAPVWTLLPPAPDYDFGETPRSKTRLGRGDERHAHRLHHAQVQKTKGVTRPRPPAGASSHPFPALRLHRERQDQAGTVLGLGWKVDIGHRPSRPRMDREPLGKAHKAQPQTKEAPSLCPWPTPSLPDTYSNSAAPGKDQGSTWAGPLTPGSKSPGVPSCPFSPWNQD